ncbi:MAG: phytanoyl-CoA dioxygenase family protein [Deltaproteobacteria bacterium]|nr:phytanoyl-CoA dioxygenase family protein [Deltaproteobacteria bacterium]
MQPAELASHLERIKTDGYTVVENAIEPALIDELLADLERIEKELGTIPATNRFEGEQTLRVYNLLAHGPVWQRVPVHPSVLPIVEGVLDPGCLISSLSSIAIGPGERPQPIHADDALHPIPRPHPATVCNTMWALTDFTEANGATRIMPGTHLADHAPEYGASFESIPAEMGKGSVLVWHGSFWHGGGANTTEKRRVGIAMNYCGGWIRQQENQQLGLETELVSSFEPRLQELCGFGVYSGLIGHIDKQSPAARLFGSPASRNVWEEVDDAS